MSALSFLDELGMKNTYLQADENNKRYLSRGYNSKGEFAPIDKNPLLGGGGGMVASLPDLITFMKFQLESNDPLIKEATRELFKNDDDDVMGYLWQDMGIGKEEGFYYSKTGTSSGTQSGLLICPDSNYGLIAIANSTTDAAFKDWANLFFSKMEVDLIKYPKINLASLLKPQFLVDKEAAKNEFNTLKVHEDTYFNTSLSYALNSIGYDLMASEKNIKKSTEILEFATKEFPENFYLYDSLGEAYFVAKDYSNAILNYKKSLELNPDNTNADEFILNIEGLMEE